ncbi:hypothetical protein VNO77_21436 [Canavalia gladiata]|uniref:Uncharacterized protein n=1 Tax=Canavalia gladiata TaxID=3824 RepID=A0AAN9LR25_CANGL
MLVIRMRIVTVRHCGFNIFFSRLLYSKQRNIECQHGRSEISGIKTSGNAQPHNGNNPLHNLHDDLGAELGHRFATQIVNDASDP